MMLVDRLDELLKEYAEEEGTTLQAGLRDILTDLMHLADKKELDFQFALANAEECYDEECQEETESNAQASS